MSEDLDRLARAYGIAPSYVSERGEQCIVGDDTKRGLLEALGVLRDGEQRGDPALPSSLAGGAQIEARCFVPDWLVEGRAWGITCQLYGLRSARNWGIGDFGDLAAVAELAAASGADFIGVNPLHALFAADPSRFSPYSPSSRRFLNPLYIAIDALDPEVRADPRLDALRAAPLVEYRDVAQIKLETLARLHGKFLRSPAAKKRFEDFCAARGDALYAFALYEALSEHLVAEGHPAGWHRWPEEYRQRDSEAVKRFARSHARRIDFHRWLGQERPACGSGSISISPSAWRPTAPRPGSPRTR
jgi:4-alpha-glucanotransferase